MYQFTYQLFDKNPANGGSKIDEQEVTLKEDEGLGELYSANEKWIDHFQNGDTLCFKDGNDYVKMSYKDYDDVRFIVKPSVLIVYPRERAVEEEIDRNPIFISRINPFEWNSTLIKEQGSFAKQQIHNYYSDAVIQNEVYEPNFVKWAQWSSCQRCGRSIKLSYPLCKTQRYLKEELMKAKLKRDLQDMSPSYVDRFRLRRSLDDIETYPDSDKFGDIGEFSTKKPSKTTGKQPPVVMDKVIQINGDVPYRQPPVFNSPPSDMAFPGMFPLNANQFKDLKNGNLKVERKNEDAQVDVNKAPLPFPGMFPSSASQFKNFKNVNKLEEKSDDKFNGNFKEPSPVISYSANFQPNMNQVNQPQIDKGEQENEVDDDDYPESDDEKWDDISMYTICKSVKPRTEACFRPCRKVVSPEVESNTKKTNKTIMHQMHQSMNKTKHVPQERKKLNDSDIAKTLSRLWDNQIDFQHQASLLIQKSRSHIDLILSALLVFILSIGIVLICCCIFLTTKIKRFANNPLGYLSKQYHQNNRLTAPYLADKDIARTVNTLSAYKRDQEDIEDDGKDVDEEHNIPEAMSSRSLTSRSLANKSLGNKSRRKINEEIMALNGITKSRSMKKFVNMEKAASSKF